MNRFTGSGLWIETSCPQCSDKRNIIPQLQSVCGFDTFDLLEKTRIMTVWLGTTLVAFVLIIVVLMIKQFFWNPRLKSVKNKHVVVSVSSNLEKERLFIQNLCKDK